MKKLITFLLLFLLLSAQVQAWGGDRTSHVYTGAATGLAATYSSGSNNVTSGYDCSDYETILVYVTTGAVVSAGVATVTIEYSPDGITFYPAYSQNSSMVFTAQSFTLSSASTSYCLPFRSAGQYFRVRIAYASGTSIVVSSVTIEGKS